MTTLNFYSAYNVQATGSSDVDAYQLQNSWNTLVVNDTTTFGNGVILNQNNSIEITNTSSNDLLIYPDNPSSQINALGAGNAFVLTPGNDQKFSLNGETQLGMSQYYTFRIMQSGGNIAGVNNITVSSVNMISLPPPPPPMYSFITGFDSGGTTDNIYVGIGAGTAGGSGSNSVSVGNGSLNSQTTANANTGIGVNSLATATTGGFNCGLGANALQSNVDGHDNVACGFFALQANTSGSVNTVVGSTSFNGLIDGSRNTGIGYVVGNSIVHGNYNTLIGANADVGADPITNSTALGYGAIVSQSNQCVLGGPGTSAMVQSSIDALSGPLSVGGNSSGINVGQSGQVTDFISGSTVNFAGATVEGLIVPPYVIYQEGGPTNVSPLFNNWPDIATQIGNGMFDVYIDNSFGQCNISSSIDGKGKLTFHNTNIGNQASLNITDGQQVTNYFGLDNVTLINFSTGVPSLVFTTAFTAENYGAGWANDVSASAPMLAVSNPAFQPTFVFNTFSSLNNSANTAVPIIEVGHNCQCTFIISNCPFMFVSNGSDQIISTDATGQLQINYDASLSAPYTSVGFTGTITNTPYDNAVSIIGAGPTNAVQYFDGSTIAGNSGFTYNGSLVNVVTSVQAGALLTSDLDTVGLSTLSIGGTNANATHIGRNTKTTTFTSGSTVDLTGVTVVGVNYLTGYDTAGTTEDLFVGQGAGNQANPGVRNLAVGDQSLRVNTTGFNNIALGFQSLYNNTTGLDNVGVGFASLNGNTTGQHNVAVGRASLYNNIDGQLNVAIGGDCLNQTDHADRNIAIGMDGCAGALVSGGSNIVIGNHSLFTGDQASNNNVIVGQNSNLTGLVSNSTLLGNGITCATSNTCVLGVGQNVLSNLFDSNVGSSLSLGVSNATSVVIGQSGVATRIKGQADLADIAGQACNVGSGGPTCQIGFYGAGPVVQPTTAGGASVFVAGAGNPVLDVSTFDGYTLQQLVFALRSQGLLA